MCDSASGGPLDLVGLVDDLLGSTETAQAVLKLKPKAGRYDFKDQIEELKTVIRPLKDALSERLRAEAHLREHILKHQDEVNMRLSTVEERLDQHRRHLDERMAVERDQCAYKVQRLRQQVLETERAWQQKEIVQERAVAERDRQTEALHQEALGKLRQELHNSQEDYRKRLGEASELLQRQIQESEKFAMDMQETYQQKEQCLKDEWISKLEQERQFSERKQAALTQENQLQIAAAKEREEQFKADHERALKDLREEHQLELDKLKEASRVELDATKSRWKTEVTTLRDQQEILEAKHREQQLAVETRNSEELARLRQQSATREAEARAQFEKQTRAHETEIRELKASFEKETEEREAKRQQREQRTEEEHREEVKTLEKRVFREREDHEEALREAEQKARTLEKKLREDYEARLEAAAREAQKAEQAWQSRLDDEQKRSAEALSALRSELKIAQEGAKGTEEELQVKLSAATTKISELETKESTLSSKISTSEAQLRRLEGELSAERSRRDCESAAKQALQADQTSLLATLEGQKQLIEELQEKFNQSQSRLGEYTSALQKSEMEVEGLRDALAEEQARLQQQQETLEETQQRLATLAADLGQAQQELDTMKEKSRRLSSGKREIELEFHSYREHHNSSNAAQMKAITDLRVTVDKLTQRVDAAQLELGVKSGDIEQHRRSIRRLEEQLSQSEATRRELHNTIQELRGNIRVICRIRPPPSGSELALKQIEDSRIMLNLGGESYNFNFDKVFSPSSVQEDLFAEVSGLIQSALDGYKVCIFAYGQTGSGKTYTMQGGDQPSTWGLIPRALRQIFKEAEEMRLKGWTWTLKASFMEVYNEVIRDLLREETQTGSNGTNRYSSGSTGSSTPQCHTIKHDPDWGMMVTNMTVVQVSSIEHIKNLTNRAAKLRAVGSTDMNSVSSRSHSIFALYLSGSNPELNSELRGALHLVDLAGSERLDRSGAVGDRLKETQNINRSLSSLADVFLAKAENRPHVPFRNSKLTHLMEPCLSGQGKTLMAVNVAPEESNLHETLCSLRFASQVSQCTTGGKPKKSSKNTSGKPPTGSPAQASNIARRGGC